MTATLSRSTGPADPEPPRAENEADNESEVAAPTRSRSRLRSWAATAVWTAALVALAAVVWPTTLGGRTSVTIVSGMSMEPTYHTGDAALVRKTDDIAVGDVIVYAVPKGDPGEGGHVIHRVIGGDADTGYRTQGDNRPNPDIWRPRPDDIVGTVQGIVPQGGTWAVRAVSPIGFGIAVAILALWVLWPHAEDETEPPDATGDEPQNG